MPTGLENELLNDSTVGDLPAEEEQVECTDEYFSNAYGQQYCVGDTFQTNDGPMTVTSIWEGQAVTDVYGGDLDADELYGGMGVEMGMSEEQFASFIDNYNELKREASALESSHHVLGPTEVEIGRLGIRIRQENPDWTDEQVQAEVDRLLDPKTQTAEQYADLAAREAELFAQYGMKSQNHATFGEGVFVNDEGKYFKFTGSNGYWQQTSQDDGFLDYAVPAAIAIGGGIITGGIGGALGTGALGATVGGAVNSVIGSAIVQGAMTGSIDPNSLLTSAILGGIGGFADSMVNGDLAGTALDEGIWELSDMLNLEYAEVVDILEGVATGAVSGGDLESIVTGAVGTWGQSQIVDYLESAYGDTLNVDDWFKDGESHIPIEALEPIIGGVIDGITNGTFDDPTMWGKAIWDYFQAGGDIDFMLPDGIGIGEWFEGSIGCPEWAKTEQGNCLWDGVKGWGDLPDVLECMPGFDFDEGLRQCLPIPNPCGDGLIWDADLGECLPDIDLEVPDVLECMEGFQWSDLYGKCVEKLDSVDVVECVEGWEWSDLYGKCVEKLDSVDVVECVEGWEWSDLYGKCVEKLNDDIDIIECVEGWEWSDLYGKCVEKINDDIDIIECVEGWEWSDLYGKCVEKLEIDDDFDVDTEGPDIDVDIPDIDLPELPPAPQAQAGAFTPSWSPLFQTGTVDVYKAPPLRSLFKDYL
jgi:hypothetical protein